MRAITRTVTATVVGFAVGAGAASGGIYTYMHMNPAVQAQNAQQTSAAQYATVAASSPSLPLGPSTISNVVKRVGGAIVKVEATVPQPGSISSSPFFNPFFGSLFGNNQIPQSQPQTDIGSGFFFNSKGYLLTNDHVIHNATRIRVYVPGYNTPFIAQRVGTDYATDLAVLKINPPKPVPTLALGNSNSTPVGAWTIAIGNPYNLSHTVTVGVVSAKGRPLTIGSRNYRNLLQTSAAINPGNSGGPLLNLAGQVIGINTAVSTQGQGIGFAIPTSTVEQILPQLMKNGRVIRPWVGVFIATDTPRYARRYGLPTSHGVILAYVIPSSPAANAGLTAGDVVTQVNGKPITTASQFKALVDGQKVGSTVQLTLNNQGHIITKSVTLGQQPNGPITVPSSSSIGN